MNITYNANSGFGILMIMIGLAIVVGVIERCPLQAAPSDSPCDQKIVVKVIPEKETFEIGEEIKLINNSQSIVGWRWSLGGSDSITDGGINERVVKFIYRRDGDKKIRLVNRHIKCRKIVHSLHVNEEKTTKKRPKRHSSCPVAKIRKVGGKLHCYTHVQFDAGLSGHDDLVWSFDELKTITATGNRVWHKFIDETTYPVRVYCKGREIGRQDVYVTCF